MVFKFRVHLLDICCLPVPSVTFRHFFGLHYTITNLMSLLSKAAETVTDKHRLKYDKYVLT